MNSLWRLWVSRDPVHLPALRHPKPGGRQWRLKAAYSPAVHAALAVPRVRRVIARRTSAGGCLATQRIPPIGGVVNGARGGPASASPQALSAPYPATSPTSPRSAVASPRSDPGSASPSARSSQRSSPSGSNGISSNCNSAWVRSDGAPARTSASPSLRRSSASPRFAFPTRYSR